MFNTNEFFTSGRLSVILDAQAGSSGKGVIGSFICEHADNWQFACNAFSAQAGHWVKIDGGKSYFYQTFNSCAYANKYDKLYIGPGASIELDAFFRELEESNIKPHKVGIHPLASIIQPIDGAFERGEVDFDGNPVVKHDGTMKTGSTCHGVGACRARRMLRRPNTILARDIPKLREFICDTSVEIMNRLDNGQAGLLEIAQGFQLSYLLSEMYPYVTSRNCTVSAGLDDMMLPPIYAGNVLLNFRTFPIRINSNKFIAEDGKHLTWAEVQDYEKDGRPYKTYRGNSGPGYSDQVELSWDEITEISGSPVKIIEQTSVTKLPRRVFSFSKENMRQATQYNKTSGKMFGCINFANYVDHDIFGRRGGNDQITTKFKKWMDDNITDAATCGIDVKYIGTGPLTNDKIIMEN